jgi:hypothetical protein
MVCSIGAPGRPVHRPKGDGVPTKVDAGIDHGRLSVAPARAYACLR